MPTAARAIVGSARIAVKETHNSAAAAAYTATGSIAKITPPSAGPAMVPIWFATLRSASAPCSWSSGTSSGVSARAAGLPIAVVTPATPAIARNGQIAFAPTSVTATRSAAIRIWSTSENAVTARRGSRSASWACRQSE